MATHQEKDDVIKRLKEELFSLKDLMKEKISRGESNDKLAFTIARDSDGDLVFVKLMYSLKSKSGTVVDIEKLENNPNVAISKMQDANAKEIIFPLIKGA
jgi:hypothetical protein